MKLELPKWITDEIELDSNKSVQYVIKEILREYLESNEGGGNKGKNKEEGERERIEWRV